MSGPRVALMWGGTVQEAIEVPLDGTLLAKIAAAFRRVGLDPIGISYADERAEEVRARLLEMDGVLVFVNPIHRGRDRTTLDALLAAVAAEGVLVSAHPQTIQRMGTKEVLYETRAMLWGSDTRLYRTFEDLRRELPRSLAEGRPRVLKQHRGNGGNGVWKVELAGSAPIGSSAPARGTPVRVRHAVRGSVQETTTLEALLARMEPYFAGTGRIIDQVYQLRLPDGMVRCYLVRDQVAGFGEQKINALYPAPANAEAGDAPDPGPRLYYPPERPDFATLRKALENQWLPELLRTLDLSVDALPLLWDADFLYGPRTDSGEDTYVLCEINVSAVFPFPDPALEPLARATHRALQARGGAAVESEEC